MLGTLFKDERCQILPCYNILEKMHLDRIIKHDELTEFTSMLQPHQRATIADGQSLAGQTFGPSFSVPISVGQKQSLRLERLMVRYTRRLVEPPMVWANPPPPIPPSAWGSRSLLSIHVGYSQRENFGEKRFEGEFCCRVDDFGSRRHRAQPAGGEQVVQQHNLQRARLPAADHAGERREDRQSDDHRGKDERLHRPGRRCFFRPLTRSFAITMRAKGVGI